MWIAFYVNQYEFCVDSRVLGEHFVLCGLWFYVNQYEFCVDCILCEPICVVLESLGWFLAALVAGKTRHWVGAQHLCGWEIYGL